MVSATFMQKTVLLATPVQPNVVSTGVASRRVYRSGLAKGVLENVLSEPKIRLRIRGEWPELDYSAANPR